MTVFRSRFSIALFVVTTTLLVYQNCTLYQSDARKVLDSTGFASTSNSAPSACLPYLASGDAAAIMDPLKGTPSMSLTSDQYGNPACLIWQGAGVGADKIQCSVSTAGRNILNSNVGFTKDTGVPSSFLGAGYYRTISDITGFYFEYYGAKTSSSLGVVCAAVFTSQTAYTSAASTILSRSRQFMTVMADKLK